MTQILHAKPVVEAIKQDIAETVEKLKCDGITPSLGIIRVGERADDVYYEASILRSCEAAGIASHVFALPANISQPDLEAVLHQANTDPSLHGILLFRPLPMYLDEDALRRQIVPHKDIDGMSPINLGKIFEGRSDGFAPCTAAAVMEILRFYGFALTGARVTVIGRSLVVGKPLAMLLLQENATVTLCHSKTVGLAEICRNSAIVVAALGKAHAVGPDHVTEQSVLIDVGINDDGTGKICGDIDQEQVIGKVQAITPVPGGVGTVTTALLMKQVVLACQRQC